MFDVTDSSNLGKEYKGFVLLSIDDLKDYKAKGVFLRHRKTGLEVYHVIKEDKENLFAFGFRTVAKDSKGTAHIMEHSTLCGSEKYPLKEPFTTLAGQSINTFLNAITYPDKTVYPAASLVPADYFNMMDVYADSVFFPKLDKETFIQEGHRLEMDDKGNLSIQGVVYNEMKGNYSSFNQIAYTEQVNAMFPNSYPSFDSGGDPLVIPELTYQEFLEFHQKFYNPDNCILFLYGDIPTYKQLDFLDEHFMARIEKKYGCKEIVSGKENENTKVKPEIQELMKLEKIREPVLTRKTAPVTGSTGSYVTVNWYTGKADMEKYFLSEVLCGNDTSPLTRALKESELGDEDATGNFGQFQEEFFTAGLWGVKKGDEEKVFDLVQNTMEKIYEDGINQSDIDAAVMGIDFNLREVNRYWGPVSIQIMEKALKGWCNGETCASQLTPITSFEEVKKQLKADKDYTKKLIKKYFIDNKVTVKVVVEPDDKYFVQREEVEKALIKKLEANLDKAQLKKELDELHAYQQHIETPQETACMPHLKISELDKNVEMAKTDLRFVKGADGSDIPLFINKEDTSGIFYLNVLFPFDQLSPEYYQHIPFLSTVLTNLGWNGKKWDDCTTEVACTMGDVWGRVCCGSISNVPQCRAFAKQYEKYNFMGRNWIEISGKALTEKAEESLKLMAEVISKMDFDDKKHYENLLQEFKADKKAGLVSTGRDYALNRSKAVFSPHQALMEIMWGASQLYTIKNYTKKNAKKTLETFKYIYSECVKSGGIINITADEDSINKILPLLENFTKEAGITKLLPGKEHTFEDYSPYIHDVQNITGNKSYETIQVESQTGYAAMVIPASDTLTKESAAETIYSSWLSMHALWDKIRTTGGAYGAGAWNDSGSNFFGMTTYRDPSPEKSLDTFKEVLKEYAQKDISQEDIERTVVSEYGSAITPRAPKDRGRLSFENFIYANYCLKQQRVDAILKVDSEAVKKAAQFLYEKSKETCHCAVFCNKTKNNAGKILTLPL